MRTVKFFLGLTTGMIFLSGARAFGGDFHVCLNPDQTLRHVGEHAACKPGERRFILEQQTPGKAEQEGEDAELTSLKIEMGRLKKKLAELEPLEEALQLLSSRVDMLERTPVRQTSGPSPAAQRVRAPFEVVDAQGGVILRVAAQGSSSSNAGARVVIGPGSHQNYGVRVAGAGGKIVAGLGESEARSGIVVAGNQAGLMTAIMNGNQGRISVRSADDALAAAMTVEASGGMVAVYNDEKPVSVLQRSQNQDGGNLSLYINDGSRVFAAGSEGDGAAEACVIRKGGNGVPQLKCLGIALH